MKSTSQTHATPAFELVFSAGDKWVDAAVKLRTHQHASCLEIDNLCEKLQTEASSPAPRNCMGFLSANPPNSSMCYCVDIAPTVQERRQIITLHQLLCSTQQYSRFPFFERDRLQLAIILSSSLLQLHSTPWLQDLWTTKDIVFRLCCGDLDGEAVVQPYVSQTFPGATSYEPRHPPPMVRNAALYALGKVLIQLVENKPLINDEGSTVTLAGGSSDPEQESAARLERTIYRKAGRTWADVIRRCLYCDFGTDTDNAALDNDEFTRCVYSQVVYPLTEALKNLGDPL